LAPHQWSELPLYHVAALEIQRAVRRSSPGIAARRLQAWFRRLASSAEHKAVFAYFRDLCARFQRGCTPVELLRVVNPREVGLADAAADLSVMLRLGGAAFPPGVYYKVTTGAAVCDVGAFAPRSYATERSRPRTEARSAPSRSAAAGASSASVRVGSSSWAARGVPESAPEGWYERWENNGWRPVAVKTLREAEMDPVAKATAARRVPWHWSKLKRHEDKEARRRERKRRWLQRLYADGLARERDGVALPDDPVHAALPLPPRPTTAQSDASWASADLRALSPAALRRAAERSVRARLGLTQDQPLSVDAFLTRVLEDEGEEKEDDGPGGFGLRAEPGMPPSALGREGIADGCPVDFEAKDWEEQAESLLEWAEALDPDTYADAWGTEAV